MNNRSVQVFISLFIVSAVLALAWFLTQQNSKDAPAELAVDEAIQRIRNKDFTEARFKPSFVEFIDGDGGKYVTTLNSDPTRELLIRQIDDLNSATRGSTFSMKVSEEPASSGFGWFAAIYWFPILFGFIGITTFIVAAILFFTRK